MARSLKARHVARNASFVIAGIIIVIAVAFVVNLSIAHGPTSGVTETTSGTQTTSGKTSSGSAQVSASTASCTGSGTTEECRMTLTNSGNTGTAITGAGTLHYRAGGMAGTNDVNTMTGCTVSSGSLSPGQTEIVSCKFSVSVPPNSGANMSGTVALSDGSSVSFSGTAS